ncbi:MAG: hypothetical protein ACLGIJ_11250 [Candidatus Limnocylindria bacterium]
MAHDASIDVRCEPTADGWRCIVEVDDRRTAGRHEVTVSSDDAVRLSAARGSADVERLVEESFDYLLEREPRSSILAAFDLTVIETYLPGWEREIAARLAP